jgi:hypothetical protein
VLGCSVTGIWALGALEEGDFSPGYVFGFFPMRVAACYHCFYSWACNQRMFAEPGGIYPCKGHPFPLGALSPTPQLSLPWWLLLSRPLQLLLAGMLPPILSKDEHCRCARALGLTPPPAFARPAAASSSG